MAAISSPTDQVRFPYPKGDLLVPLLFQLFPALMDIYIALLQNQKKSTAGRKQTARFLYLQSNAKSKALD